MSEVSKIQLPDNTVVDIKDARIPGVDNVPTSGSSNLVKSGGVYSALLSPSLKHVAYEGFVSSSSYAVHCGVYFKPDDWDKMCSFRFRVHAYVPSQANVESISDITVQCYQGVVKSYYIMNGIADTSNYAYYSLYYYGVTEAGHNAGAQGYFGVYINSANCWSYTTKRQLEYDLIHAEGCTVGFFTTDKNSADARQGYASGNFASSVKYNTYTAGLQETGDSNTTYSVISNDELRTGTATSSRTVSAARLAANYSITTDSTTGVKTVNIAGNSATIPEEVEANPTVPSGTTPSSLTGLKVGSDYYEVSAGSSDAVLYTSQSLTDAQKKQARLNQGLYYPEQVAATTITWDGDITGKENFSIGGIEFYKVASSPVDAPIYALGTATGYWDGTTENITLTWSINTNDFLIGEATWGCTGDYYVAITRNASTEDGSVSDGIYFSYSDFPVYVSSLSINSYIHSDNTIPTACLEDVASEINTTSTETEVASGKAVYNAVHPKLKDGGSYIDPNVLYDYGYMEEGIVLYLNTPSDNTIENEYKLCFRQGSTVSSLTWPAGITWIGNCLNSNGVPVMHANCYYEVSIMNSCGIIVEWKL